MSEEQLKKLKQVIKDGVAINREGEVELSKELQAAVAGGVTPEGGEEDEPIIIIANNCTCVPK